MKKIARIFLKLLTLGIPVVVAACYGAPYVFRKGKVVDRDMKQPIEGIQVAITTENNTRTAVEKTDQDGMVYIELQSYNRCLTMDAEDVDGDQNGRYEKTSVSCENNDSDPVIIEMKKL